MIFYSFKKYVVLSSIKITFKTSVIIVANGFGIGAAEPDVLLAEQ
jgi:hypothetical protein